MGFEPPGIEHTGEEASHAGREKQQAEALVALEVGEEVALKAAAAEARLSNWEAPKSPWGPGSRVVHAGLQEAKPWQHIEGGVPQVCATLGSRMQRWQWLSWQEVLPQRPIPVPHTCPGQGPLALDYWSVGLSIL